MEYYKGENRIIYMEVDGDFVPVGCLTSDGFTEESDFINTTTRQNNGWETSRPVNQRFSVDFSGLVAKGDNSMVSYLDMVSVKRSRQIKNWKLSTLNGQFVHNFSAYVGEIGNEASAGGYISFSVSLVGASVPEFTSELIYALATGRGSFITDGRDNFITGTNWDYGK